MVGVCHPVPARNTMYFRILTPSLDDALIVVAMALSIALAVGSIKGMSCRLSLMFAEFLRCR